MSQRFEGRNLEEALNHAAEAFGVARWQLSYHTLLEKRGFLGGMKRIVIEADVNEDAQPPAVAAPLPPLETHPPRGPERGGRGGGGERRGRGERRGGGRSQSRGGRGRRDDHPRRELRSGDFEAFLGDVPEQGPESEGARAVREWVDSAISLAQLDLVTRSEENESQIIVRLYGVDAGKLTDRHGELLDALQVLANKALTGRAVEKDIELDCQEFKDRRVEDLERRAREVAERVKSGGREELLPAMTPIERRIVHLALHEDAVVTTESRGEGFYKRVAVILRPAGEDRQEP
jgi:predicted RNA-binding protein Jag